MIEGRNASSGEVWLYDPDLNFVKRWDVNELVCLEHESKDGLVASVNGVRHGILVPVPVNLMEKAGTYHFVLHFKDNHADKYKDHKVKPALEMNAVQPMPNIVSIVWEAIDPQHQKWNLDGSFELEPNEGNGDPDTAIGQKVFPDWRDYRNLPSDEIRRTNPLSLVRVRVKIDKPQKNTVYLKLFDPDDPSLDEPIDHTDIGGIKGGDDNFYDGTGIPVHGVFREDNDPNRRKGQVVKIMDNGRIAAVETERGEATILVRVVRQPGNNFKVGTSCIKKEIDNMVLASDGLRLQLENNVVPEGNEPIWKARASELLTVWRRLFVEIDSMGIVNDEERLKHEDDLLTGDVPDPDITPDPDGAGFERAFEQCYIRVIVASQYNQSNTPWHHHFESKAAEEAYAKQHRNSLPEANDLWFVYAIGMYDPPENPTLGYYPTDDNDPEADANNYSALIGRTHGGEKEAVIGPAAEPEYSFCYIEVLRDVAKEWGWYQDESKWMTDKVCHVLRVVTLHEIAHHFDFMIHNEQPNSVMWAPSTNVDENTLLNIPLRFAPSEIKYIRKTKQP